MWLPEISRRRGVEAGRKIKIQIRMGKGEMKFCWLIFTSICLDRISILYKFPSTKMSCPKLCIVSLCHPTFSFVYTLWSYFIMNWENIAVFHGGTYRVTKLTPDTKETIFPKCLTKPTTMSPLLLDKTVVPYFEEMFSQYVTNCFFENWQCWSFPSLLDIGNSLLSLTVAVISCCILFHE